MITYNHTVLYLLQELHTATATPYPGLSQRCSVVSVQALVQDVTDLRELATLELAPLCLPRQANSSVVECLLELYKVI